MRLYHRTDYMDSIAFLIKRKKINNIDLPISDSER